MLLKKPLLLLCSSVLLTACQVPTSSDAEEIETFAETLVADEEISVDSVSADAATPVDSVSADAATPVDSVSADAATPADTVPAVAATPVDSVPAVAATPVDSVPAVAATPVDSVPGVAATPVDSVPAVAATPVDSVPAVAASPVDIVPAAAIPLVLAELITEKVYLTESKFISTEYYAKQPLLEYPVAPITSLQLLRSTYIEPLIGNPYHSANSAVTSFLNQIDYAASVQDPAIIPLDVPVLASPFRGHTHLVVDENTVFSVDMSKYVEAEYLADIQYQLTPDSDDNFVLDANTGKLRALHAFDYEQLMPSPYKRFGVEITTASGEVYQQNYILEVVNRLNLQVLRYEIGENDWEYKGLQFVINTDANDAMYADAEVDYDFTIYWGDATTPEHYSRAQDGGVEEIVLSHEYSDRGTYFVFIKGNIPNLDQPKINLRDIKPSQTLKRVEYWSDTPWLSLTDMQFSEGIFSDQRAVGAPNLSNVTSLADLFSHVYDEDVGVLQNLQWWDVSSVQDFSHMFHDSSITRDVDYFTDISHWNTSSARNMRSMFSRSDFNQNINAWDTSSVTDMSYMFYRNEKFNQPLSLWNTSAVKNMGAMFNGAYRFNQNINRWDVSAVEDMSRMFAGWQEGIHETAVSISAFNQPLNNWDTSAVLNMRGMFSKAINFNQPLNNWDTKKVSDMALMFEGAYRFNGDITTWNTSAVEDMYSMFHHTEFDGTSTFNQDISSWDVSAVKMMMFMFKRARSFRQDLSAWDVSNVVTMDGMFIHASKFRADLSNWNVCKVMGNNGSYLGDTDFVNHTFYRDQRHKLPDFDHSDSDCPALIEEP